VVVFEVFDAGKGISSGGGLIDGRLDDVIVVGWEVVFIVCYQPGYILDHPSSCRRHCQLI